MNVCPNCGEYHTSTGCMKRTIPTNAPHWPPIPQPDATQKRIADALERIAAALEYANSRSI